MEEMVRLTNQTFFMLSILRARTRANGATQKINSLPLLPTEKRLTAIAISVAQNNKTYDGLSCVFRSPMPTNNFTNDHIINKPRVVNVTIDSTLR